MTHEECSCRECSLVRDHGVLRETEFVEGRQMPNKYRGIFMTAATLFVGVEDLTRIRTSLAADGVEVIPAAGLEEAIQASSAVILLDADGHAAWAYSLRHVVEMRPTAKVVVLARNADHRMWVEVLSQGAHDLVPKPLLPTEVRAAVLGALQIAMRMSAGAAA
jgi:DNA-binding NtrC family response regulator